MYCTNCGHENSISNKFCEGCGKPLNASTSFLMGSKKNIDWNVWRKLSFATFGGILLSIITYTLSLILVFYIYYTSVGGEFGLMMEFLQLEFKIALGQVTEGTIALWVIIGAVLVASWGVFLFGIFTGGFQWLILRQQMIKIPWILLTTLGGFLGIFFIIILALLFNNSSETIRATAIIIGFGMGISLAQWQLLRKIYSHALIWLIANLIPISITVPIGAKVSDESIFIGVILSVLIYSCINSIFLVWLIRQPTIK